MIIKPQLKKSFRFVIPDPDNVVLLDESDYKLLTGRAYACVIPLLDGQHTADELVDLLGGKVFPPEVYYVLHLLEAEGHIVEADDTFPDEVAAFWHDLNVDTQTVSRRLTENHVSLTALGGVSAESLASILKSLSVQTGESSSLGVVLTDDYLQDGLAQINRESIAAERPWLLVKPVGNVIWLGPLFRPGQTGCWECLAQRLRANRQMESYLQGRTNSTQPFNTSLSSVPSTREMALNLAATEIVKTLVLGANKSLEGKLLTFDTGTLETTSHALVRRPQCAECGEQAYRSRREPEPFVLQNQKKTFTADGGHRSALPEETLEKYKHHISPLTGIVTSLSRLSGDAQNGLIYSYQSGHNFALMNDDLFFLLKNLRGRSGGKGMTDVQARASAVCEAIERYSGVFRGDEISRRASYRELAGEAVHPNDLMHFSERQYQNRLSWNKAHSQSAYHMVPEEFDEDAEIEWTSVWSLTNGEFKYVPTAYCYYGHPDLKRNFFCTCDANGNAAGNTREEAVLQGFMELVERDCVCLWWYNRLRMPGVDLDSFDEPYFGALAEFYQTIKREFWVLDITSDFGIPAFAAISRRVDREVEDIVLGFGAHFDPKLAILRALTEVNQFLPAVMKTAPDGSTAYWFPDQDAIEWWKTATLATHSYLAPKQNAPLKQATDYPRVSSDDLLEDVNTCVSITKGLGMETLVLDQTRPDIGLPVVKVLVPGMRHFWKRFGAGRLYDVPVKSGWLKEPLTEDQLNPVGIFF
jgi:bacteriocin biosynthesis cyclodehydratase domain-containing protein